MMLLAVRDLHRQFDASPVLDKVSFHVGAGERIGLVGPNGAGKTTLLRILAGEEHPDSGDIETPPQITTALLEQEADFPPHARLIEIARQGLAPLYALQRRSRELAERMARESGAAELARLQKAYDEVMHGLERHNAFSLDHRVDEVLHGLGFSTDEYERPVATFSGGQQNRLLLARMLLREPDILLLDEPTNHLDIAAVEWLEDYLRSGKSTVILVSHDRYFLDRVTTRTFELISGRLTDYAGNFTAYRRQREDRNKVLLRTFSNQQDYIAKTRDFIRRNKYGQKHAQAADREKKLARLEMVNRPPQEPQWAMTFGEAERTGDWVIDAEGVSKGYGRPLFSDVTLRIHRGDRLGILGPNGSGKTTLLRVLIGDLEPDEGTVRQGTGVRIGYFDQQLALVASYADALEAVRPPDDPAATPGTLRSLLARFGVCGESVFQPMASLSGGEKSRVALAKLAAADVNLLVLDEPTNHLDLWSRDALEKALREFSGTLIFVSHDRYFLDRLATRIVVLEEGTWRHHPGSYSDDRAFRETRKAQKQEQSPPDSTNTSRGGNGRAATALPAEAAAVTGDQRNQPERVPPGKRKRKFPYRKVSDIEADIAEQEELLAALQRLLADPQLHRDGERVKDTLDAFDQTKQRLEELYDHWEEAAALS